MKEWVVGGLGGYVGGRTEENRDNKTKQKDAKEIEKGDSCMHRVKVREQEKKGGGRRPMEVDRSTQIVGMSPSKP